MRLPPRDREAPLEEHLAELRERLLRILLVIAALTILLYPLSDDLIRLLREDLLLPGIRLVALNPLEYLVARIKLSATVALIIGVPFIVYELFRFVHPGLFPSEERFFLMTAPASLLLFLLGGTLSYSLLTPRSVRYLLTYTGPVATPVLVLEKFISFVTFMLLSFGLIFQIPLLLFLAVKGGLIRLEDLTSRRRYIYAALLLGSLLLSPDPTPLTPLLIAGSLFFVFEGSLFLVRILR
jgi:sec-independent protein translocase protein TatC